jgi:mannitol/fructose-specific phosphotransferase system IIA component (Ntr-type)
MFRAMSLRDFFEAQSIALPLRATSAEQVLPELVGLLRLDERATSTLLKVLGRREELGSTGVGRGIAIPHGRSLVVNRVRLAYAHSPAGIAWRALDDKPVHHFFLIAAPPIEVSNQYLPTLGKIATFAKEADVPDRLSRIQSPEEFFALLDEKGV